MRPAQPGDVDGRPDVPVEVIAGEARESGVEDPSFRAARLVNAVLHLKRFLPLERTTVDLAASLDVSRMHQRGPRVRLRRARAAAGFQTQAIGAGGPRLHRRVR